MPGSDGGATGAAGPVAPDEAASALSYAGPGTARPEHTGAATGLTRLDVAALALRLLGLYAMIQAAPVLATLPGLLMYAFKGSYNWTFGESLLYAGPSLVYLTVGVLLIAYASRLAPKLLPPPVEPVAGTDPTHRALVHTTGRQLQAIAVSVVGLLLVTWSLPSLIQTAVAYLADSESPATGGITPSAIRQNLVLFAVQFAAGVWLFLGSRGLAVYWHRLRRHDHARDHARDRGPGSGSPPDGGTGREAQ